MSCYSLFYLPTQDNYKEKNDLLAEWDNQTMAGTASSQAWMSQFTVIQNNFLECTLIHVGHALLLWGLASVFDRVHTLHQVCCFLFCTVAGGHTIGWVLNSTSMESVPFETCIKSIFLTLQNRKNKKQRVA